MRGIKLQSMKLFYTNYGGDQGGKLQMKGVKGVRLEQLSYNKLSCSGLPYVKQGPICSKPGFNSMKLSKL